VAVILPQTELNTVLTQMTMMTWMKFKTGKFTIQSGSQFLSKKIH